MGIDARIYLEGVTHDQIQDIDWLLASHLSPADDRKTINTWYNDNIAYLEGQERYFSTNYPRGHWPGIRAALMVCQKAFPDKEIRYGSDHDNDWNDARIVDDEMLQEFDTAYYNSRKGE